MEEKKIKYDIGGMWEFSSWEVFFEHKCSSYGGGEPCKHSRMLPFEAKKAVDGSVYNEKEKEWISPRVIVVKNEGGYNSTGLCADCVLEVFNKINFDENISS
jgi:hypothetical protein